MPHPLLTGERLLAHLSTDKPMYKPGEKLYAKAILLDAFTQKPPTQQSTLQFQLKSPKGEIVYTNVAVSDVSGVAPLAYDLPKDMVGGEYTLLAIFPDGGFATGSRTFLVKAYRPPRLKSELEFVKKAYGPGDSVAATLDVKRAEGGIPVGAAVSAVATVDGVEVHRGELTLDNEGRCEIRFVLPESIIEGEGTLTAIIRDGGVQETAAKTIPLAVQKLSIEFYPEGGDLIANLEGRVYFEAKTSKGKPADVAGRIIDKSGKTLATFRSEHEGRGSTTLTPLQAGQSCIAVLDEPSGVADMFALPAVKPSGLSLTVKNIVGAAGDSVEVFYSSKASGKVIIAQRDRVLVTKTFDAGAASISLQVPAEAHGVLRVTLYDEKNLPRAERLIFRHPKKSLRLEVEATPTSAGLREKVKVTVRAVNEAGALVPSVVSLAAVDDAVLESVERRERAPRLPTQALLEGEVNELFDAHVYLAAGDDAARKLELLLSTQGWRRFSFDEVDAFLQKHKERAERVLAIHKLPPPPVLTRTGAVFNMPGAIELEGGFDAGGAMEFGLGGVPDGVDDDVAALLDGVGGDLFGGDDVIKPGAAPIGRPAPQPREENKREMAADIPAFAPAMDVMPAPVMPAPAMPMPAARPPMPGAPMPKIAAPAPEQEAARGLFARVKDFLGIAPKIAVQKPPVFAPEPPMPPMPPLPQVFRVYAHTSKATTGRTDFTETLLWVAGEKITSSKTFEFDLCDSITSFKIMVDAYSDEGAMGIGEVIVEARKPFYLEPKLPFEVTYGDLCEAPVAVINGTAKPLSATISAEVSGSLRVMSAPAPLSLKPEERARFLLPMVVGHGLGQSSLTLSGKAGEHSDQITKEITVAPEGFPQSISLGGKLSAQIDHSIVLDAAPIPGSLSIELLAYPGPLASLQQAVAALLREPCGCFEQTSSSAYPNVMVMEYLSTHVGVDPSIVKRAQDLLDRGYKRLISYECKEKGYEWFGANPGHEALTAYGLMEFTDMSRVFPVDGAMLKRTQSWLLSRRDGKGGYTRNPQALDTFGGAPQEITNAYITWALSQTKAQDLSAEIASLKEEAKKSNDPYLLSLIAGVLLDANDADAKMVLEKLAKKQQSTGEFFGERTSITGSGGESLTIEATSLAILAFLRDASYTAVVESAMAWLLERCKGGRFGATQSTILALKAIVTYDAARATPPRAGVIRLLVDGNPCGEARFTEKTQGAIPVSWVGAALTQGAHQLRIMTEGAEGLPYSVQVNYHTAQPASAASCAVSLKTSLSRAEVSEGETFEIVTELQNETPNGLPMVVAIIGFPGGAEPRVDQLKELVKEGKFDAFELRNREIILYWRGMAPRREVSLRLSLIASIPGRYAGPASRAYLYYTDEFKCWSAPLSITIKA